MKNHFIILLTLLSSAVYAQNSSDNFAIIKSGDTQADIIRKAATLTPSPRQLRWQQLELTAFFHFGVNTFSNKEWGTGKETLNCLILNRWMPGNGCELQKKQVLNK